MSNLNPGEEINETENKLLLLYFIEKMDIALSNSQISQFMLEENYMSYFSLQQSLDELVKLNYLDKAQDNNTLRYTITDEGVTVLEYFEKHVPAEKRIKINKYVAQNRKTFKKDYEITANYFYEHSTNEFVVKCGIYEDESMLMEINLSVVSKEQARQICSKWKTGVNGLYNEILMMLISDKFTPDENENASEEDSSE